MLYSLFAYNHFIKCTNSGASLQLALWYAKQSMNVKRSIYTSLSEEEIRKHMFSDGNPPLYSILNNPLWESCCLHMMTFFT